MKKNALFEKCLANVNPVIKVEVDLNMDIANKIDDILKARGITQRELAAKMGVKESAISRWLTGANGFTTKTIAAIETALGEKVVTVNPKQNYVFLLYKNSNFTVKNDIVTDGIYTTLENQCSSYNIMGGC